MPLNPGPHTKLIYLLLAFWLFASASGMHGHYCFDGQEPPVSVHFDVIDSHDHSVEHLDNHKDIDSKPMAIGLLKLLNLDLPFLIAALLLFIWPLQCRQVYGSIQRPSSWITLTALRPPLRAPPIYACQAFL